MRKIIIAFWIVLALVALPDIVMAAEVDMNGKWVMSIEEHHEVVKSEFVLNQDGNRLTGTYKNRFGEAEVIGKVRGIQVELAYTKGGGVPAIFKGTVIGDKIAGTANFSELMIVDFIGEKK